MRNENDTTEETYEYTEANIAQKIFSIWNRVVEHLGEFKAEGHSLEDANDIRKELIKRGLSDLSGLAQKSVLSLGWAAQNKLKFGNKIDFFNNKTAFIEISTDLGIVFSPINIQFGYIAESSEHNVFEIFNGPVANTVTSTSIFREIIQDFDDGSIEYTFVTKKDIFMHLVNAEDSYSKLWIKSVKESKDNLDDIIVTLKSPIVGSSSINVLGSKKDAVCADLFHNIFELPANGLVKIQDGCTTFISPMIDQPAFDIGMVLDNGTTLEVLSLADFTPERMGKIQNGSAFFCSGYVSSNNAPANIRDIAEHHVHSDSSMRRSALVQIIDKESKALKKQFYAYEEQQSLPIFLNNINQYLKHKYPDEDWKCGVLEYQGAGYIKKENNKLNKLGRPFKLGTYLMTR